MHACVDGKAAAWQEFMRRFNRIIAITSYRAARRRGEDCLSVVDDLTQETYLKLCADGARVLREFESPHPDAIFGFLKVVTANVAKDYFKRLDANKRRVNLVALEEAAQSGDAVVPSGLTSVERAVLLQEVDACLSAVAPPKTLARDRTIFWLYYRQGLKAKAIAALPSINLTLEGVESTLHRLTKRVRAQLVETSSGKKARGKGL